MFIDFANLKLEIPEAPLRMTRPRLKVTPPHTCQRSSSLLGNSKGFDVSISLNLRGIFDRYLQTHRNRYIYHFTCVCVWIDYGMNVTIPNLQLSHCYNCSEPYWITLYMFNYSIIKCCQTLLHFYLCIRILCTRTSSCIPGFHVNHSELLLIWSSFVCFNLCRR